MIELVLALVLGFVLGVITGLLPSLHPNNLIPIVLSVTIFSPMFASVVLLTAGVVNSFVNFIPSMLFGAPEDATALGALPGHRLMMQGRGYEAVKLSVAGCLGGILFSIIILPIFVVMLKFLYESIRPYISWLLIAVVAMMIYNENGKKKLYALVTFLLSGLLGIIVLDNFENAIFPLLSGLFGLPLLLISIVENTKLPESIEIKKVRINFKEILPAIGIGSIAGIVSGLLPGVGSTQSTVLTQQILKRGDKDERKFLVSIGSVTSSDYVYSLFALYIIGNPRSGIAVAIGKLLEIDISVILIFVAVILIAAGLAAILTLRLTESSLKMMKKIDYKKLSLSIIILIWILILVFSGFIGVIISFLAALIGLIPNKTGVKRSNAMGCLILPTTLFFLNI